MKKIYCKPSVVAVKINISNFICTSVQVMGEYEEGNMTDLSRSAHFTPWSDDYDEQICFFIFIYFSQLVSFRLFGQLISKKVSKFSNL